MILGTVDEDIRRESKVAAQGIGRLIANTIRRQFGNTVRLYTDNTECCRIVQMGSQLFRIELCQELPYRCVGNPEPAVFLEVV